MNYFNTQNMMHQPIKLKIKLYLLTCVSCILIINPLAGQDNWDSLYHAIPQRPDSLRFQKLYELSIKLVYSDEDYFRKVINEANQLLASLNNRAFGEAKLLSAHSDYHSVFGMLDSSIWYLEKAKQLMEDENDRGLAARFNNNIALLKRRQGHYEEALKIHLESFPIFEELGDSSSIYRLHNAVGTVYSLLGKEEKSIFHYQKMLDNAIREGNLLYQADGYTNIGNVSSDSELSISNFKKAIPIYRQLNKKTALIGTLIKLGKEYTEQGLYHKALDVYNQTEPLVIELNSTLYKADLLKDKSKAMIHLKRYEEAIGNLKKAREIYQSNGDMGDELLANKYLYQAQAGAGRYKDAYETKSLHSHLVDSTKSIEVLKNISELETKYETEKKEAQIVLLNKEAELDDTRKKALWGGLGLLAISSVFVLFGLNQRHKKRSAIELEKRKLVEQELVFKKKELTAKALQLASKNEFLQSLEEEVIQLTSSIDDSVSKTSARISRMIKSDSNDEAEWNQFSKEFTSIHQDFIDRIVSKYGSFTQSEMRLISLLKMNLSSKEIANILRVSDEGIKKARYRLRKKMNLENSDDLSAIIHAM